MSKTRIERILTQGHTVIIAHSTPEPAFKDTAPHIRGRVFGIGETWFMQVVNTASGKVLASDNTNDRMAMLNLCHEAVAAARGAWTFNYKRKDLRSW